MSTPRYRSLPYDHGFSRPERGVDFETKEAALAHAASQQGGRVTSFTGRVQEDIAWRVVDLATGERVLPDEPAAA